MKSIKANLPCPLIGPATLLLSGALASAATVTVTVPNGGFEAPAIPGNQSNPWTSNGCPNWTMVSTSRGNSSRGVENPPAGRFSNGPNGEQNAYINLDADPIATAYAHSDTVGQVVAGGTYTLTIAFANRGSDTAPDGSFGLYVNGSPVGSFTTYTRSTLIPNAFKDLTYTWTSPGAGDPLIGGSIRVRMNFTASPLGGWQQAVFDDVRLDVVPEPSGALLGLLGVTLFWCRRRG